MKVKRFPFLLIAGLFVCSNILAQLVNPQTATEVAKAKVKTLNHSISHQLADIPTDFKDEKGDQLFYLFNLKPTGYIVVSADRSLPPVVAYSFTNGWGNSTEKNPMIELLVKDMQSRKANLHLLSNEEKATRITEWDNLLSGKNNSTLFEQWPPEGTTSTGGWLETNWKQGSPYNQFCPMDPVTNQRSVAGCPSVAIAMLINYYETINNTKLTDEEDDYYHSYAGRNYQIDDDYETIDFITFPEVNAYFDTITSTWESGSMPKPEEAAALIWACGVAAQQVYTSSISGTFGVDQAYNSFLRFGYEDADLLYPGDPILSTLSQNMMEARPALLAVIDPGVAGHNLVTDGYNTDGYYHLNFGWGGSFNGWYLIPDEIPYNLTEFEGVVANIAFPPVNTGLNESNSRALISVYPNPVKEYLYIKSEGLAIENLRVFTFSGKQIMQVDQLQANQSIDLTKLSPGKYILSFEVSGNLFNKQILKVGK